MKPIVRLTEAVHTSWGLLGAGTLAIVRSPQPTNRVSIPDPVLITPIGGKRQFSVHVPASSVKVMTEKDLIDAYVRQEKRKEKQKETYLKRKRKYLCLPNEAEMLAARCSA